MCAPNGWLRVLLNRCLTNFGPLLGDTLGSIAFNETIYSSTLIYAQVDNRWELQIPFRDQCGDDCGRAGTEIRASWYACRHEAIVAIFKVLLSLTVTCYFVGKIMCAKGPKRKVTLLCEVTEIGSDVLRNRAILYGTGQPKPLSSCLEQGSFCSKNNYYIRCSSSWVATYPLKYPLLLQYCWTATPDVPDHFSKTPLPRLGIPTTSTDYRDRSDGPFVDKVAPAYSIP